MSVLRKVWLSKVEYRPNPARPEEGRVPLGIVLAYDLGGETKVELAARFELEEGELRHLDRLSRELLRRPWEVIDREIGSLIQELPNEEKSGRAFLSHLARENVWSFHVSPPAPFPVKISAVETKRGAIDNAVAWAINELVNGRDPLSSRVPPLTNKLQGRTVPAIPPAYQLKTSQWSTGASAVSAR
jgi:hypothetical protein